MGDFPRVRLIRNAVGESHARFALSGHCRMDLIVPTAFVDAANHATSLILFDVRSSGGMFGSGAFELILEKPLSQLPESFHFPYPSLYVGRRLIISEHGLPLASRRFGDIKRTTRRRTWTPFHLPCSPAPRSRLKNNSIRDCRRERGRAQRTSE